MSFIQRITTAVFTALPSTLFFATALSTTYAGYYWKTNLMVASALLGGSLIFGFSLPPVFRQFRLRQPWMWSIAAGILAMLLALFVMTALNATPLCVGQDNGDGKNDFGMCMGYVFLYAFVFGPTYMILLTLSTFVGHWVLKRQLDPR